MRSLWPRALGRQRVVVEDGLDAAVVRARLALGVLRARRAFRGAELGRFVTATGRVLVEGAGRLSVGERTMFVGGLVPSRVFVEEGAELLIGARVVLNYGVRLWARRRVVIGDGCLFGSFAVLDDDGAAPIVLEREVWVAHGARVGAGVTIGARSVVSAGSVVTRDVPPDSLAIGAPARCMPLAVVARERENTAEAVG